MMLRRIIHVDMDAFFAAIEQRDRPELAGQPIAVGGTPQGRGVVAAASYEARQFGVKSAMPAARARRLCPELVFIRPRFDAYRREAHRIRDLFRTVTPTIEPLSLDEAYLDVTDVCADGGPATPLARELKQRIRAETGLTASAGVSYNKFLAKLASDQDKPDGLYVIPPERASAYVARLPVRRLHGVGPATAERMEAAGISTGADLQTWSLDALRARFGRAGAQYHALAHGQDERPVQPRSARRSVGQENTFARDCSDEAALQAELERLAAKVAARLDQLGCVGRTLTVKVRFADFTEVTRQTTRTPGFADLASMRAVLADLLGRAWPPGAPVRLLGVAVANLVDRGQRQGELWGS